MGELELLLNCFRTSLECDGHEVRSSMQCRCFTLPLYNVCKIVESIFILQKHNVYTTQSKSVAQYILTL